MTTDINKLLKIYLGTDENGGYQPIGCEERIMSAFPIDYNQKMDLIAPYLNEEHSPDWAKNDLLTECKKFEGVIHRKYPEIEKIVVRSLVNRWSFSWK